MCFGLGKGCRDGGHLGSPCVTPVTDGVLQQSVVRKTDEVGKSGWRQRKLGYGVRHERHNGWERDRRKTEISTDLDVLGLGKEDLRRGVRDG